MADRAFYDTVIFVLSLNAGDRDHPSCCELLDVDDGRITWCIVLSAITRAEATIDEYLNQLEQRCAVQGVDWIEVKQEQIAALMKQKRKVKSKLEQAGMQSRDVKQAFAAASARASVFVTRDQDFFDPENKNLKGKKTGTVVRDVMCDELSVEPLFPAEALARLRVA